MWKHKFKITHKKFFNRTFLFVFGQDFGLDDCQSSPGSLKDRSKRRKALCKATGKLPSQNKANKSNDKAEENDRAEKETVAPGLASCKVVTAVKNNRFEEVTVASGKLAESQEESEKAVNVVDELNTMAARNKVSVLIDDKTQNVEVLSISDVKEPSCGNVKPPGGALGSNHENDVNVTDVCLPKKIVDLTLESDDEGNIDGGEEFIVIDSIEEHDDPIDAVAVEEEGNHEDSVVVVEDNHHKDFIVVEDGDHKDSVVVEDDNHKDAVAVENDDHNDSIVVEDDRDSIVAEDDDHKVSIAVEDNDPKDSVAVQDGDHKTAVVVEDDSHKDVVVVEDHENKDSVAVEQKEISHRRNSLFMEEFDFEILNTPKCEQVTSSEKQYLDAAAVGNVKSEVATPVKQSLNVGVGQHPVASAVDHMCSQNNVIQISDSDDDHGISDNDDDCGDQNRRILSLKGAEGNGAVMLQSNSTQGSIVEVQSAGEMMVNVHNSFFNKVVIAGDLPQDEGMVKSHTDSKIEEISRNDSKVMECKGATENSNIHTRIVTSHDATQNDVNDGRAAGGTDESVKQNRNLSQVCL